MQETQVGSLGQEDPLEEDTVTDSSILAWSIQWTEHLGGLHRIAELDRTERLSMHACLTSRL